MNNDFDHDDGIIGSIKDNHRMKEFNQEFQDNPITQLTVPDLSERVCETLLGALVNGAWIRRRVIVTRERISFALVGNDHEVDVIPLAEIKFVEEMSSAAEPDSENSGADGALPLADRKPSVMPPKLLRRYSNINAASRKDDSSNSDLAIDLGVKDATQHFVNALHIATTPGGYNSGRSYYLQAPSGEEKTKLIALLRELSRAAYKRAEKRSRFQKSQDRVRCIYMSTGFQSIAALLIVANFMANLLEAQFVQDPGAVGSGVQELSYALEVCNLIFTAVFAAELVVNAYAHWLQPFIQNPWSMLDAFIVLMSLVALGPVDLPVSILRLMRAFRVIRLFGRLQALKKMISALTASIVPMLNAFLILFIIAAIYSVMGVSLFADNSFQDFGRFSNAFVTMFHLTSEGAWPPGLAAYDEAGSPNWTVTAFCTSYVVLVNWVVLQVSVAVLLDNFVSSSAKIEEAERRRKQEETRRKQQARSPIEPLLKKLTRDFVDDADLSEKLRKLFQVLDFDDSNSLSCEEFCEAIKKLEFRPRIHVAPSDFLGLTRSGQLCDENGELGPEAFEQTMRDQIRMYMQGQLCNPEQRSRAEAEQIHLAALKWLMLEHQRAHRDLQHLRVALPPSDQPHPSCDHGDDRFDAPIERSVAVTQQPPTTPASSVAAQFPEQKKQLKQKNSSGCSGGEGEDKDGAERAANAAAPSEAAAAQTPSSRLSWVRSFRAGAASWKSTRSFVLGADDGSGGGGGRGEAVPGLKSANWFSSSSHAVADSAAEDGDDGTRKRVEPDGGGLFASGTSTATPVFEKQRGGGGGCRSPSAFGSVVVAVRRRASSDEASQHTQLPDVATAFDSGGGSPKSVFPPRVADQSPGLPTPPATNSTPVIGSWEAALNVAGGSGSGSAAKAEPLAAAAVAELATAVCELVRAELGGPIRALAAAAARSAVMYGGGGVGSRRRRLYVGAGTRSRRLKKGVNNTEFSFGTSEAADDWPAGGVRSRLAEGVSERRFPENDLPKMRISLESTLSPSPDPASMGQASGWSVSHAGAASGGFFSAETMVAESTKSTNLGRVGLRAAAAAGVAVPGEAWRPVMQADLALVAPAIRSTEVRGAASPCATVGPATKAFLMTSVASAARESSDRTGAAGIVGTTKAAPAAMLAAAAEPSTISLVAASTSHPPPGLLSPAADETLSCSKAAIVTSVAPTFAVDLPGSD